MTTPHEKPPVVLLGGSTGPLALARELTAHGVDVHLSLEAGRPELSTKHAAQKHPFPTREQAPEVWGKLLLGPDRAIERAVVFPCDDDGVEFVARNHSELLRWHLLDRASSQHLGALLSKAKTAEIAAPSGVRLPRTWEIDEGLSVDEVFAGDPPAIILKPVHSHLFQRQFGAGGRKHFVARSRSEFIAAASQLREAGLGAIATELIPGPDSGSVTYYAYRTAGGRPLFEFTKQVLRRFPRNEGPGSLHVARWDEEIAVASRTLLDSLGFEGYANIEFKRDERDGLPTLIEVNPRFTASQELLVQAGISAGWIVYSSVIGNEPASTTRGTEGLLLWDPARDVRAFRQLRREEGLGLFSWLGSLRGRRVLPLFRWSDPRPSAKRLRTLGRRLVRGGSAAPADGAVRPAARE